MADKRCILITAGPTHEPIDAVRYIANRSSGRLGVALADAAADADLDVTLLLGPTTQKPSSHAGVEVIGFETAYDLAKLLDEHFPRCDVLIMAAAVADYRPTNTSANKLPRTDGTVVLELESTDDLLANCAAAKKPNQFVVGFALEQAELLETRAREKLDRKKIDAIVANPLATMGATDIDPTIFTAAGQAIRPGKMGKDNFAHWLIEWLGKTLA